MTTKRPVPTKKATRKGGDAADKSSPKTTRAEASERREPPSRTAAMRIGRNLDAMPDRVDIRDWPYQPTLSSLPPQVVSIGEVPSILDQGQEGACTGFGLAAVINYQLAKRRVKRQVSPRMLYEMARKYDEWPGENYEGSSARGAMIGWTRHGVCAESLWCKDLAGAGNLTPQIAKEAQLTPGGAFYRVLHTQVRDVHAAVFELGAVYMTIMVHSGWAEPGPTTVEVRLPKSRNGNGRQVSGKVKIPVIKRVDHATDGHAVAIVGYTADGFIIQNSWGKTWGYQGFALLPYEDFMIHATDVWAAQLGVAVNCDVWAAAGGADTSAGLQRAADSIPLATIRPYIFDCGNNGVLSDSGRYWTTEQDVSRMFDETIPVATKGWKKKRVLLYLHGGLNNEDDVAKRVVSFRDVLLENEVYPLHIMWESGAMETIGNLIKDVITEPDSRAGAIPDWMKKLRDRLVEAKDRTFEISTARAGTALWGEMKRNAQLSSTLESGRGAMEIISEYVKKALSKVSAAQRGEWEFHVVAHSAGSIYFAYALEHLLSFEAAGINFASVHFMAPAVTTDLFKTLVLPKIKDGSCPFPSLFMLSNVGELDDNVGPYGKSLLYLVSNAFEGGRNIPLLGMQLFLDGDRNLDLKADPDLSSLFHGGTVGGHPALVIAGAAPVNGSPDPYSISRSNSHGGFDNDPDTLNSILLRIIQPPDAKLKRSFTTRDLQY